MIPTTTTATTANAITGFWKSPSPYSNRIVRGLRMRGSRRSTTPSSNPLTSISLPLTQHTHSYYYLLLLPTTATTATAPLRLALLLILSLGPSRRRGPGLGGGLVRMRGSRRSNYVSLLASSILPTTTTTCYYYC